MTAESHSSNHLINQSVVRFSSGSYTSHAYSNIVDTPVVGPVIVVHKKTNACEAALGQVITYTLTITNKGNLDAQVTLFDNMPEGTALIPNSVIVDHIPLPMARPDQGIPLGNVRFCQTVEVTFQVIVLEQPSSQQLKNQASTLYHFHTSSEREVTGSSKSNTVIIPFKQTKITFTKKLNTIFTYVGDTVTFYFTVNNEESYPVKHAFLKDELAAGAAFVQGSFKIDQTSYPSADPSEGVKLGEIPACSEMTIQFQCKLTSVPLSGSIINSAILSYLHDSYRGKIVSNALTLQVYDPALTAIESVLQHQATLGDTLTYTLTISNHGNIATDVWLSDFIPEGSSYVVGSLTVDGVPYSEKVPSGNIPLGVFQPHQSILVTLQVIVNSFAISSDQKMLTSQSTVLFTFRLPDDRTVSNRIMSNWVRVELLRPILDILLSASPNHPEPGSIICYRIHIANTGNLAASQVNLLDWISPLNTLVPGTLRVNGLVIQGVNVKMPLPLGTLLPNTNIEIIYEAAVIHHPNSRRITLRVGAKYEYQVNRPMHQGTVLSNVVVIKIDHADE